MDDDYRQQIRSARGAFAAMAATYGLGVFNDSFFRQSTMLLAAAMDRYDLQGWIMAIFSLPYIIVAPQAGWLADRFPKRMVVILAKALELIAMICGAIGIISGQWSFIMVMVFTMGLQSCLFNPALNGSIPELYPASYVSRANATIKIVTTAMILGGIAFAGVALGLKGDPIGGVAFGKVAVAVGIVSVSLVGLVISFFVPSRSAADPKAAFPWLAHGETFRTLALAHKDGLLLTVILANSFLWFSGSLVVPLINTMATQQGWGAMAASGILVCELTGVAVGGIIGARLCSKPQWWRIMPRGILAMAAPLIIIPFVPDSLHWTLTAGLFACVGISGGMVMIPCASFTQIRPLPAIRGATIAASNFVIFTGIVLSGPISIGLLWLMPAKMAFSLLAALTAAVGLKLLVKLRDFKDNVEK